VNVPLETGSQPPVDSSDASDDDRLLAGPKFHRGDVCRTRERLHRRHHGGAPACEITAEWANYVDQVTGRVVGQLLDAAGRRELVDRLALVATGGLGRRESSPHSDVDLMLLYHVDESCQIASLMQRFVPAMFDCGLQLSHCARTIDECAWMAVTEPTVRTSFAGCRFVFGSRSLFQEMQRSINEAIGVDRGELAHEVLQLRLDERREFCPTRRDGTHNVKLSPGGLRDVQSIAWSAWLLTGQPRLAALARWLPEDAALDMAAMEKSLWRLIGRRLDLHFHHRTNNDFFPGHGLSSLALYKRMDGDTLIANMQVLAGKFERVAKCILQCDPHGCV
jgi:UTP:GlnB (protein PII) uridylyltransferase